LLKERKKEEKKLGGKVVYNSRKMKKRAYFARQIICGQSLLSFFLPGML